MTIKEIAKLAGVSISTVSKIVNNKDENINPKTRERVLSIVKEYHYTPYGTVKKHSTAKTFMIGVLLPSIHRKYTLLHGIQATAQANGYCVLVYDCEHTKDLELKHITSLCSLKVDGVIWQPLSEHSLQYAKYFEELDIPICYHHGPSSVFSHQLNYETFGYETAKTLLDYKHQKIGCYYQKNSFRSIPFIQGFKKCLFDYQIPYQDSMLIETLDNPYIFNHSDQPFTGFVCSHYHLALQLSDFLSSRKYHIPNDFSIVSLREDDIYCDDFGKIPYFSIPFYEFGQYLCEHLLHILQKTETTPADFTPNLQLERKEFLDLPLLLKQKKLVVVGSINIDITLNVPSLPQSGETLITDRFSTTPGGKGMNQAAGATKLGADVSLIGKVGTDLEASMIYDYLVNHRIEYTGVTRAIHEDTGKAFIQVQNDGDSTITILTGANKLLTPSDLLQQERSFRHAGYCLLQTEVPIETILLASQLAHKYGAKTILKPAGLSEIPTDLLKNIDIFIPNGKEATLLCKDKDTLEEKADYFLSLGAKAVIITLGKEGCYLKTPFLSKKYAPPTFSPIDCTGASDAFIATLAVYLQKGKSLDIAIQIASVSAGFCIARQGVIPALPDQNTLESHLKNFYPELLQ